LRTPTAQLAINGGSQHPSKRKAGGHGPTLADEVEWLLPSPAARDWRSGQSNLIGTNARPLSEVVEMTLLPTPEASDASGGRVAAEVGGKRPSGSKRAVTIATVVARLPNGGDHTPPL
jgi:hypothetical protein